MIREGQRMTGRVKFPSDMQEQVTIRLPDGMREKIKDDAKRNKRSMNTEIVEQLLKQWPIENG